MTVFASADPDEIPATRTSDSNMLLTVLFDAPLCVRALSAVRANAVLSVVDFMKSTPLVDSGSPTTAMIYLSQESVGTVAHQRNGA
jgi:hypothetical protein